MDWLELFAAALGIVSVACMVRRNILVFPTGIVMVLIYTWIFYREKLYSDMLLQVFFAVVQAHGWWLWQRAERADDERVAVRRLSQNQWIWTGVCLLGGFLGLGWAMDNWTDAAMPYMDAFVTVESVLAQIWMNRRYVENWVLWIGVNQVAVFLYAAKSLWFTAVLYGVFLAMAVAGYLEWSRKLPSREADLPQ